MANRTRILEIQISNFKNFRNGVHIKGIGNVCNLIGAFSLLKQDLVTAVFFGLGAGKTELVIENFIDIFADRNRPTFVELTFQSTNNGDRIVVRRSLMANESAHIFDFEGTAVEERIYRNELSNLGFDLQKQIVFYGALDRNFCWSVLTTEHDELIAIISDVAGLSNTVRQCFFFERAESKATDILTTIDDEIRIMDVHIEKLEEHLPCEEHAWEEEHVAYTTSCFKRQEIERAEKSGELVAARLKLANIQTNIDNFQVIIDRETEDRNTKISRNRQLLERFHELNFNDDENVQLFEVKILKIKKLMEMHDIYIDSHQTHIAQLERHKNACEANVALMETLNGTRRQSRILTADALLKLYPLFHGSDEIEIDKQELESLEKQEQLNEIEIRCETTQKFDALFSIQQRNQTDNTDILGTFCATFKSLFQAKCFLHQLSFDEIAVLEKNIPRSQGFALCKAFRPADDTHNDLISNILSEFRNTIVLYRDETKAVYNMLNRVHPHWFRNVRFLVLTSITGAAHARYVLPPDHWLNFCTYNVTDGNTAARSKLIYNLGTNHDIRCVETHVAVQHAFEHNTKEYVASVDGRLIYMRNAMGIDVLIYFHLDRPVKQMHFPEACSLMKNANSKVVEWLPGLRSAESTTWDTNIVDPTGLRAEVDVLKTNFVQLEEMQTQRMEILRERLNASIDVADEQNYADRLREERASLDGIRTMIAQAQTETEHYQDQQRAMSTKHDSLGEYIQLRAEFDRNKAEVILHNETIKTNETYIKKDDKLKAQALKEIELLKIDFKNLKYATIKTFLKAQREHIDCTNLVGCTTNPPTLFQDIRDGRFVDPLRMWVRFVDMTDTFDPDNIYGHREWYIKLNAARETRRNLVASKADAEVELQTCKVELDRLTESVNAAFQNFNNTMTKHLNDVAILADPATNIQYKFRFHYKNESGASETILITRDGHFVGFDNLSITDQAHTHWLLFVALQKYSKARIAFIDLSDETEEIIRIVAPIIQHITNESQLFITCSHKHHLAFADLQFGIHETREGDGSKTASVIKHDCSKYVTEGDAPMDRGRRINVGGISPIASEAGG